MHKVHTMLPYDGTKCNKLTAKMKILLKISLPNNIQMLVTYQILKLPTKLDVNNKIKICH